MAIETPTSWYIGITCLIVGNEFFMPNMTSIISKMYEGKDEKKAVAKAAAEDKLACPSEKKEAAKEAAKAEKEAKTIADQKAGEAALAKK